MGWLSRWIDWLFRNGGPATGPSRSSSDPFETADYPPVKALALASGQFRLRAGAHTTVGNVREHNEDNYYVPGLEPGRAGPGGAGPSGTPTGLTDGSATPPDSGGIPDTATGGDSRPLDSPVVLAPGSAGLFVVADGMGGQQAGERASQMAVEIIPVELDRRLGGLSARPDERAVQEVIRDVLRAANDEILAQSNLDSECNNMGTTVVLTLFRDDRAYIAGIGDSRVYLLREGRIEQLTEDHSLANALAKAQSIRPEEVETHKYKHVLYLYLGSREVRDTAGPDDVRTMDIRAGDRYLLATDGLTGVVRDAEIAEVLGRVADPQQAAQILVNRALEALSKDNITCVVVHVE